MSEFGRCFGGVSVLAWLGLFGYFYNRWIARVEKRGELEGFVSLAVALGVGVTVLGIGALDLLIEGVNAGVLALVAFGCSGTPMMWGSMRRYVVRRRRDQEGMRDDTA